MLLGTGFPVYGRVKYVLGGAMLLQLVYDWYWNLRLRRSWVRHVLCVRVCVTALALLRQCWPALAVRPMVMLTC